MKRDQARLLADTRLSPAAVVLGLRISAMRGDEHELKADDLAAMLHSSPSRNTVSGLIRELRIHGYVEQVRAGGNGAGALYAWRGGAEDHAQSVVHDPEPAGDHAQSVVHDSAKSANHAQHIGHDTDHAQSTVHDALPHARALQLQVEAEAVVPPPVVPLASLAEEAIEANAERLAGCRGALRDYLRQRVPSPRQSAFVWSAVGFLDSQGFTWGNDEGVVVPPGERPRLLANALNQLLASDEKGYKAPEGDPRNVLSKLRIICGQHGRKNGRGNPGGNGTGGSPAAASTGKGGRRFDSE